MQTYFTEICSINPSVWVIFVALMLLVWTILKLEDEQKKIEKQEKDMNNWDDLI